MEKGIFISYRRDDAAASAGRLFDRLERVFDKSQLFMDVDGIELGVDFSEVIGERVGACEVLLAVIGERWATLTDDAGRPRLSDENDFVRLEIATALARHVRVIPVLVDKAQMPRADQLPADLQPLLKRQAARIRNEAFAVDCEPIILALQKVLGKDQGHTKTESVPGGEAVAPPRPDLTSGRKVSLDEVRRSLPPVSVPNDAQADRFGGKPARKGRRLSAVVTQSKKGSKWCNVHLKVATDAEAETLIGESVFFFVHQSFNPSEFEVKVDRHGVADLKVVAWGAFTAGAVCDNGATWLELNLADPALVIAPADWQER